MTAGAWQILSWRSASHEPQLSPLFLESKPSSQRPLNHAKTTSDPADVPLGPGCFCHEGGLFRACVLSYGDAWPFVSLSAWDLLLTQHLRRLLWIYTSGLLLTACCNSALADNGHFIRCLVDGFFGLEDARKATVMVSEALHSILKIHRHR